MDDTTFEKTAEELQREINELHRQQREITERLRDPRGLRRGTLSGAAPRFFSSNQGRRGLVRPADRINIDEEPPAKRRLSSAVVKVKGEDIGKDGEIPVDGKGNQFLVRGNGTSDQSDQKLSGRHLGSWSQMDADHRVSKKDFEAIQLPEPAPRVVPKNEDPNLINRNKRMLGNLLGTLEKFRKEDKQLCGTDAYARRSAALQRAEQKARQESEQLRLEEREQLTEKRRRDLTLRARVASKAEQKKLELLFLQWSEHQKKLSNFIRTKAEPPIYYALVKPLEVDTTELEQYKEQPFIEWKSARRQELNQYQKEIEDQNMANVEKELERWQNAMKGRKANNEAMNLQETMDKELETHRMEHGPKKRKIPGGDEENSADEEDEIEDIINGGEDEMIIDDLLDEGGGYGNRKGAEVVATVTAEAEAEAVRGDNCTGLPSNKN